MTQSKKYHGVCLVLVMTCMLVIVFLVSSISACKTHDTLASPSPSGEWLAQRQIRECSSGATSTTILLQVLMRPRHGFFPAWKEEVVFSRNAVATTKASDAIALRWRDDKHLEIVIPPCMMSEPVMSGKEVVSGPVRCGDQGMTVSPTSGINVTMVQPPLDP